VYIYKILTNREDLCMAGKFDNGFTPTQNFYAEVYGEKPGREIDPEGPTGDFPDTTDTDSA